MEMIVHRAGQLTTVQDPGRRGHRAAGVPLSGPMDPVALRIANWLVGNPGDAAVLEFTLAGPEVEFTVAACVAVGGAECEGLPTWQTVAVAAGERLGLGGCRKGARGYLAVAGGFDVPVVMDSRSTYLRAGFGGWQGRALRDGDRLPVAPAERRLRSGHWRIDSRVLPAYSSSPTVRVIRGAQAGDFPERWAQRTYAVTTHSDRMGLRLSGEKLVRDVGGELLSSAVAPGTVQVPPDGQPIVLMADAQTIGGYPQLAHAIAVDLPLLGQLRPGDTVQFAEVTLTEAHALTAARERALGILHEGLRQKFT